MSQGRYFCLLLFWKLKSFRHSFCYVMWSVHCLYPEFLDHFEWANSTQHLHLSVNALCALRRSKYYRVGPPPVWVVTRCSTLCAIAFYHFFKQSLAPDSKARACKSKIFAVLPLSVPRSDGPRQPAACRTASRTPACSTRRCTSQRSWGPKEAATTARLRTASDRPPSSPSGWTSTVSAPLVASKEETAHQASVWF